MPHDIPAARRFDVYLPMGEACTPAFHIQLHGLRRWAYPLDWMVFPLSSALHLFQTDFEDFFAEVRELTDMERAEGADTRHALDPRNDVYTPHYFPIALDLEDARMAFVATMRRRYRRLRHQLETGSSLLILSCRDKEPPEELHAFLGSFSELYPHLTIHMANVRSVPDMGPDEIREEHHILSRQLSFSEFAFNNDRNTLTGESFTFVGSRPRWADVMARYM